MGAASALRVWSFQSMTLLLQSLEGRRWPAPPSKLRAARDQLRQPAAPLQPTPPAPPGMHLQAATSFRHLLPQHWRPHRGAIQMLPMVGRAAPLAAQASQQAWTAWMPCWRSSRRPPWDAAPSGPAATNSVQSSRRQVQTGSRPAGQPAALPHGMGRHQRSSSVILYQQACRRAGKHASRAGSQAPTLQPAVPPPAASLPQWPLQSLGQPLSRIEAPLLGCCVASSRMSSTTLWAAWLPSTRQQLQRGAMSEPRVMLPQRHLSCSRIPLQLLQQQTWHSTCSARQRRHCSSRWHLGKKLWWQPRRRQQRPSRLPAVCREGLGMPVWLLLAPRPRTGGAEALKIGLASACLS